MSNKEPALLMPGRYIIAVSGGIDSVVLLDMLSKRSSIDLVVAHFDHGIREDSETDALFVKNLAEKYKLPFESVRKELGPDASEAVAREARYEFLRQCQAKHQAVGIVTAHHQDDLLETTMINLLRGTGRKGVHSLRSRAEMPRPLLHLTKKDITEYAQENHLEWREDSTNSETKYLRNRLRLTAIPKADETWRASMMEHIAHASEVNDRLDREIESLLGYRLTKGVVAIPRRWFVMLPHSIASEVVAAVARKLKVADMDAHLIERITVGIKTARPGKKLDIDKNHYVLITKRSARIMNRATNKTARV